MRRKSNSRFRSANLRPAHLVYADRKGRLFDHPHLLMVGIAGEDPTIPDAEELVSVPHGSDFYTLPGRRPMGLDPTTGKLEVLDGAFDAVSVFLAPAWVRLRHPAFQVGEGAPTLPLYAYAPMGFRNGEFVTTAARVDPEPRQDPWRFDLDDIAARVAARRAASPENRLVAQLDRCALEYGCRAAQNYFLGRFEAPLPTSEGCNAMCVGCISLDPVNTTAAHERIVKSPSAEEIAEVALEHIAAVPRPVVSFGQGCEGEPLLRAEVLEAAIRLVRAATPAGTINLNSNASRPEQVERLCAAGLDSIRISLNSVQPDLYARYYRPRNYTFDDVRESARVMRSNGRWISLNYLIFPGVTDLEPEIEALEDFIAEVHVDMIQMRNLNIDPVLYRGLVGAGRHGDGIGFLALMARLRARFPWLRFGYFNPPKESWSEGPGPITHPANQPPKGYVPAGLKRTAMAT